MKKLLLLLIMCLDTYTMSHVAKCIRLYSTIHKSRWPDYSIEQAFLIADIALRDNHLKYADAYDRGLKDKIERAAAQVCPDHNPSKCRSCWRPK